MASTQKPMWMFPHERERREKLRKQIRKKQKELVKLKKELDAATGNLRPQRSTTLKTIGLAVAAPPLTLNLERSDFTDLLVPQLNSYTWAFYNCFRILQTQQTEYREIEELLLAICDGLQREGEEAKEKKKKKKENKKKPLLRVDQYYDEQLEPLAGLKDKVKRDHDAMRGLQKKVAGGAEELKAVKAGLKDLLEYVLKEYEDEDEGDGGGEEEEADAEEEDEDDNDHTMGIVPPGDKATASVPRPRVHWASDPAFSFLRPERSASPPQRPPFKVFRAVEADDDEDDSSSSSDTDLE